MGTENGRARYLGSLRHHYRGGPNSRHPTDIYLRLPICKYTHENANESTLRKIKDQINKNNLKKILDKRNVSYKYNDTLSVLRDAILESNPKETETIEVENTDNEDETEETINNEE